MQFQLGQWLMHFWDMADCGRELSESNEWQYSDFPEIDNEQAIAHEAIMWLHKAGDQQHTEAMRQLWAIYGGNLL